MTQLQIIITLHDTHRIFYAGNYYKIKDCPGYIAFVKQEVKELLDIGDNDIIETKIIPCD